MIIVKKKEKHTSRQCRNKQTNGWADRQTRLNTLPSSLNAVSNNYTMNNVSKTPLNTVRLKMHCGHRKISN